MRTLVNAIKQEKEIKDMPLTKEEMNCLHLQICLPMSEIQRTEKQKQTKKYNKTEALLYLINNK